MSAVSAILGSGFARSLMAGIAGFVVYGGWAYFVNADHGNEIGIRSGLVQGSYSLVLTFTTTVLMEILFRSLGNTGFQSLLTILITVGLLFATAYGINWLAGTPEILMTILPGFVIGSGYTVAYVCLFLRKPTPD